ncbi:neutral and basic amino acid transport protein rBAT [Phymastichus coffea]|uniref:neutral and basic amino acid transport protein rBAT n=1 Tax=Phymastichus coffea TaxID=108790 RepID=UPI00273CD704|nr:neutral and basic amino acid transport protein rBAT [Phymastichus coffea]
MEKSGRLEADSNGSVATKEQAVDSDALAQQTYKQLPDEDVNWQARNSTSDENSKATSMGKPNGTDVELDDGAQERMLKDDVKTSVLPSKDTSEVKFISENGDAKIDIEIVKQSLSGMGKAELMKYANDPFWIKLRWFLFIAFWLLWAAMLAGAIAIIVMAPKCTPPTPKKWYEENPIIKLDPSDANPSNLEGLKAILVSFQKNIKAVSLHSVLKESAPGHIVDFRDLKIGSIEEFQKFVQLAKSNEQNIILDIDPNHSSDQHEWFKKSIEREEPYISYYIWSDGKKSPNSDILLPPNNWMSINGGSAWTFNEKRQQFYLHQFNSSQPDFNFHNSTVINEFSEIFKHWINLGVKGFRIANARHLVEDKNLTDDSTGLEYPAESASHHSLLHVHTIDHSDNAHVLRIWREVVKNHTNGEGLFTMSDEVQQIWLQTNNRPTAIDIPQTADFFYNIDPTVSAVALNKSITEILAIKEAPWPGLDLSGKAVPLKKRIAAGVAESLILMTMLLPVTPIIKYHDIRSNNTAFTTLLETRKNSAFLFGDTKTDVLNNGTVFVYTRLKSGNPGYLVAYNSAQQNTTVDISTVPYMSNEVNIVAYSHPSDDVLYSTKKLMSKNVPMSPKSTLVVTFVPNSQA